MGTKQDTSTMQLPHLFMIDGTKTHTLQTRDLLAIVHNITEAEKAILLGQLLFGLLYGTNHTRTESAIMIYGNFQCSAELIVIGFCLISRQLLPLVPKLPTVHSAQE